MPKFVLFIFFLLFVYHLQAQTWEAGGSIGGAGYMGDLNPNNPVKISGLSAGVFGKRNFNGYFSAKLNIDFGKISAYDSQSGNPQFRERNLSFNDPINEVSLIGEFNFMKYTAGDGKNGFTPFIYSGLGLTSYAPRTVYEGKEFGLRQLQTEGEPEPYGSKTLVIPYGAGIKYNISGKWNFIADMGYRYTFTDYLDDVSGLYPVKSTLKSSLARALSDRSGELTGNYTGTAGSQRGDLKPRDAYFFLNFTISFTFVTTNCYY